MRDAGQERALWAAIRRYASLVPVAEVDGLLEFLRDDDELQTKQATLQAIQNVFAVEAPDSCPGVRSVRDRVRSVATQCITAPSLDSAGASLALQAVCAAIALRDPSAPRLMKDLERLGRPYLVRRAKEFQQSLRASSRDGAR